MNFYCPMCGGEKKHTKSCPTLISVKTDQEIREEFRALQAADLEPLKSPIGIKVKRLNDQLDEAKAALREILVQPTGLRGAKKMAVIAHKALVKLEGEDEK